ncbi:MAG: hypothetical protein VX438_11010, partial [Planctomycetota bacterium]|nr:hypothetical protein [Planctomycetota bacterium]
KYKYDVTWVLKHQANIGWRVSGMITTGNLEDDTIVFNFEDAADIVRKGNPGSPETQTAKENQKTDIR